MWASSGTSSNSRSNLLSLLSRMQSSTINLNLAKLAALSRRDEVFRKSPKCVGIVSVQFSDPAVILLLSGRDSRNTGQGQSLTDLESGDEKKILKRKCLWPTSKHTHGKHEHTDMETDLHKNTDTQMHRNVLSLISVNFYLLGSPTR